MSEASTYPVSDAGQESESFAEALKSDEAIVVGGMAAGGAAGLALAVTVEGMPIHTTAAQEQQALQGKAEKGAPPMVEATHAQVGTVAGMLIVGTFLGLGAVKLRRSIGRS